MPNSSTRRTSTDRISGAFAAVGRLLLLLTTVLLIAMPWTEYFWNFDGFFRYGQDFEFGLLSIATILGLVLVLLQHRKRGVAFFFAIRRWLSFVFKDAAFPAQEKFTKLISVFHPGPLRSPALSMYNFPIQV